MAEPLLSKNGVNADMTVTMEKPRTLSDPDCEAAAKDLKSLINQHDTATRRENALVCEVNNSVHHPISAVRQMQLNKSLQDLRGEIPVLADQIRQQKAVVRRTKNRVITELQTCYADDHRELAVGVAEHLAALIAANKRLSDFEDQLHADGVPIAGAMKPACKLFLDAISSGFFEGEVYEECKEFEPRQK